MNTPAKAPALAEIACLCCYGGFRLSLILYGTEAVAVWFFFVFGVLVTLLTGHFMRVVLTPRELKYEVDGQVTTLGRPLLYPAMLSHTRVRPIRNQFRHKVLMVGVPVGLRGRVGNLLSVDEHSPPRSPLSMKTRPAWFSFDPMRYLHRENDELGLRGKLDEFLKQQNEDPEQWPFAYLLSVPRFLWWDRSVVTWWYLYTQARQLDAVIMEVNNSFDEKRNVLFKVSHRDGDEPTVDPTKWASDSVQTKSLPPSPQAVVYSGSWEKKIFASPFEKVQGSISARFMDPLNKDVGKRGPPLSTTTSLGVDGQRRMSTQLSCLGPPTDPENLGFIQLVRIMLFWTLPSILTTPRIIFQAMKRHHFLGSMKMMEKPVVRPGSEPRPASQSERNLEPFFFQLLTHCIETYPQQIRVRYTPSRAISNTSTDMQSSLSPKQMRTVVDLTVEPLDPAFYTRITTYANVREALEAESCSDNISADSESQRLRVTNPDLFYDLLASGLRVKANRYVGTKRLSSGLLRLFRSASFFDQFIIHSIPTNLHNIYLKSICRQMAIDKLAFGSDWILGVYLVCGVILVMLTLLEVIIWALMS